MTNQTPRDEGHSIDWVSVEIYGQENHLLSRKIREAISIHTWRLEMNCDKGCQLPSIYVTEEGIQMAKLRKLCVTFKKLLEVLKKISSQNTYYFSFGV